MPRDAEKERRRKLRLVAQGLTPQQANIQIRSARQFERRKQAEAALHSVPDKLDRISDQLKTIHRAEDRGPAPK